MVKHRGVTLSLDLSWKELSSSSPSINIKRLRLFTRHHYKATRSPKYIHSKEGVEIVCIREIYLVLFEILLTRILLLYTLLCNKLLTDCHFYQLFLLSFLIYVASNLVRQLEINSTLRVSSKNPEPDLSFVTFSLAASVGHRIFHRLSPKVQFNQLTLC